MTTCRSGWTYSSPRPQYEPGDATYDPADENENDGEADAAESGIPGVLVQLIDDDDTVIAEAVTGAGEPGIIGALVQLLDSGDVVIAETITDADGHYRFVNLEEGTYSVRVPATQAATISTLRITRPMLIGTAEVVLAIICSGLDVGKRGSDSLFSQIIDKVHNLWLNDFHE